MNQEQNARTLGVTVVGDFIVSEGVEPILDNLQRAGVTAVACTPTVAAPAAEGEGILEPPEDAGSSPRLFDRNLFGRRALRITEAPSYHPDVRHYAGCAYSPPKPTHLTDKHGDLIQQFIDAALERGMQVTFHLQAAIPPGLRDEDRPRLPDGRIPAGRMADTASLASEAVRAYNRARTSDLLARYPQITGFRIDWPEYPCYTLGETFQDFGPQVADWARERGYDFDAIRTAVARFHEYLHGGLTNEDLEPFADAEPTEDGMSAMAAKLLNRHKAVGDWLLLKAKLSKDIIACWRQAISDCDESRRLIAHAFMPPYSLVSGFDFAGAGDHCDAIAPKLYTMHWSLMIQFWSEQLLKHNRGLDERLLVRAVVNLMGLAHPSGARRSPTTAIRNRTSRTSSQTNRSEERFNTSSRPCDKAPHAPSAPWSTATVHWTTSCTGFESPSNPNVPSSGSTVTAT